MGQEPLICLLGQRPGLLAKDEGTKGQMKPFVLVGVLMNKNLVCAVGLF